MADELGDARIQRLPDHAADVVGAEDAAVDGDGGNGCGGLGRSHGCGGLDRGIGLNALRQRLNGSFIFLASPLALGGELRRAPRQEGQQHEDRRGDEACQRLHAERAPSDVRHRCGHAQVTARDLGRQRLGPAGQGLVAALDRAVAALAQREIAVIGDVDLREADTDAADGQAHVRDTNGLVADVRRRRQRQLRAAVVLDQAGDRTGSGDRGFDDAQPTVAALRQRRVLAGEVQRQHGGIARPGPALAEFLRSRGQIAGSERRLQRRRRRGDR